jgi:hypothetical protein
MEIDRASAVAETSTLGRASLSSVTRRRVSNSTNMFDSGGAG